MPNPVKIQASVISLRKYGEGTYSVRMKPESIVPRFKPGQFLHLTVDDYDPTGGFWPESRVFSIASAPGLPEIEIVYSVKGRYTKRMEQVLIPGCRLWLKLPYGEFVIDSSLAHGQDIVLVAGGTGISPFLPYLHNLRNRGQKERTVRLYYGVRELPMLLAADLIEHCMKAGLADPRMFIENETDFTSDRSGFRMESGRLDIGRIHAECGDLKDPVFFLSGPPAMIKTFKEKLGAFGVKGQCIRIDEWE